MAAYLATRLPVGFTPPLCEPMASSATAMAVQDVGIDCIEGVSVDASGLRGIRSLKGIPSQEIDATRHGFQVAWVDASMITAQVVEVRPFRYWADQQLIDGAMRPHFYAIYPHTAITLRRFVGRRPRPAFVRSATHTFKVYAQGNRRVSWRPIGQPMVASPLGDIAAGSALIMTARRHHRILVRKQMTTGTGGRGWPLPQYRASVHPVNIARM